MIMFNANSKQQSQFTSQNGRWNLRDLVCKDNQVLILYFLIRDLIWMGFLCEHLLTFFSFAFLGLAFLDLENQLVSLLSMGGLSLRTFTNVCSFLF